MVSRTYQRRFASQDISFQAEGVSRHYVLLHARQNACVVGHIMIISKIEQKTECWQVKDFFSMPAP
jgi:hypothetical protein